MHVAVFQKDEPKIYNMIYRDGRQGTTYAKRFKVTGVTREKSSTTSRWEHRERACSGSANTTTEEDAALKVRVHLKPALRLRNVQIDFDFGELAIKGRGVKGNILSKNAVDRVVRIPKTELEDEA